MHDLLYLSETKMRVLVPQVPGRIRRRLGFEAGVNTGVISVKAKLANEGQPPLAGALDSVVKMIERSHGTRQRDDRDLHPGDWIRFDEHFRYGNGWPGDERRPPVVRGLTYFVAADEPPFALVGSAMHVLDIRQPADHPSPFLGYYYANALRAYVQAMRRLPDDAANDLPPDPPRDDYEITGIDEVLEAVAWLRIHSRNMLETRLAGYARVLAVGNDPYGDHQRRLLATPLFVEYPPAT